MQGDIVVAEAEMHVGNWWAVVLRGLIALVLGFFLITRTGDTTALLIQVFGLFAIVDGIIVGIVSILRRKQMEDPWRSLLFGLLGFAIGLVLLMAPEVSAGIVILLIALWAIIGGIAQLAIAWSIRKTSDLEWILVISGIVSLLVGWLLLRNPAEVTRFVLVLVGIFLVLSGISSTVFGFKLRELHNR